MNELICRDIESVFGVKIDEIAPVCGGWLNEKWRVTTDAGEILVKRYSHERFSRRKLDDIEQALARQMILFEAGIPCPRVWKAGDTIIRRPSEKIDYMVMDFLPGLPVGPETVKLSQMESLGEVCARMHEAFRRLPAGGVKGYPPDERKLRDSLYETICRGKTVCGEEAPQGFREAVDRAEAWIERTDFSFLSGLERSIAHEDFTPDNMLFSETGLAAILDFDRNQYSFPMHDVGRILLSLAYHDEKLDGNRVRAFQRGYGDLQDEEIKNALRLAAFIEIPWWIRPECFAEKRGKIRRFVREMLFLMNEDFSF